MGQYELALEICQPWHQNIDGNLSINVEKSQLFCLKTNYFVNCNKQAEEVKELDRIEFTEVIIRTKSF